MTIFLEKIKQFPAEFLAVFIDMGFFLMIGMFFSGLLHILISKDRVVQLLGQKSRFATVKAALFGVPLPLCSCGVIPTAVTLSKSGATPGAVTSFLISTPQTGVDSIIATAGLMGPVFAIFRPIAAFFSGVIGGSIVQLFAGKEVATAKEGANSCCCKNEKESVVPPQAEEKPSCCSTAKKENIATFKLKEFFQFGFLDFTKDLAFSLLVGMVLAALISTFIDAEFVKSLGITEGLPAMLIMMTIGLPMYICATSSIPLGITFLSLGFSPGAVFVFLFAGPVSNATSIVVLRNALGTKVTALYMVVVSLMALLFGWILDLFLSLSKVEVIITESHGHIHSSFGMLKIVIASLFALFLLRGIILRIKAKF